MSCTMRKDVREKFSFEIIVFRIERTIVVYTFSLQWKTWHFFNRNFLLYLRNSAALLFMGTIDINDSAT